MDVSFQIERLDVVISGYVRPSLLSAIDHDSGLIVGSELLCDAPNTKNLEDSIKKVVKREVEANVTP